MSFAAGAGAGSGGKANPPELTEAEGKEREEPGANEEKLDMA